MGKSNFYLYGVKGKVGNLVAQKGVKGGTTLRSYVVPKNPKTRRQIAQRIIFATVTQAARVLKPLINHSFEGVAYGNDSVNRFRSLNLKKLRTLAAKDFADTPKPADAQCFFTTQGIRSIIPNQYIVSSGSLAAPALTVEKAEQTFAVNGELYMAVAKDKDLTVPLTRVENDVFVSRADLLKAFFGITSLNEQISLCLILSTAPDYQYTYGDEPAPGFQIPFTQYNVQRLVMSATANLNDTFKIGTVANDVFTPVESMIDHMAEFVLETFDANRSAAPLMQFVETALAAYIPEVSEDITTITLEPGAQSKALNNLVSEDYSVLAAGFIRSRLVDGAWQRSTCSLVMATPNDGAYNNFGLVWAIAVDAWFESAEVASSDRYLNEGGSEDQLGENF